MSLLKRLCSWKKDKASLPANIPEFVVKDYSTKQAAKTAENVPYDFYTKVDKATRVL